MNSVGSSGERVDVDADHWCVEVVVALVRGDGDWVETERGVDVVIKVPSSEVRREKSEAKLVRETTTWRQARGGSYWSARRGLNPCGARLSETLTGQDLAGG